MSAMQSEYATVEVRIIYHCDVRWVDIYLVIFVIRQPLRIENVREDDYLLCCAKDLFKP